MKALNFNISNNQFTVFGLVMLCLFLFIPEFAYADVSNTDNAIVNTLCRAINLITGGVGKTIAILIIISLAIMLFLGKVTWGLAIAVGVGMGILFGASDVVDLISGDTNKVCANVNNGTSTGTTGGTTVK